MPTIPNVLSLITLLYTDLCHHCSKEKIHINVVVIGHVDSGKSTTTGTASSGPQYPFTAAHTC